jgi:hypothetical protein
VRISSALTVEGKFMSKLLKMAAIAAVAVCSLQARADLVIDKFVTSQSVSDTTSGVGDVSNGGVSSSIVLGAGDSDLLTAPVTRTLIADKFGQNAEDVNGQGVKMSVNTSTNRLAFSQDADQWGQGHAIWQGGLPTTSILDLTSVAPTSSFNFTYRADGALKVNITVTDTTGAFTTTSFMTIDTNSGFINDTIFLSEFDFSGFGSTDVAKIEILFNVDSSAATADIDLTLSARQVPEPTTLALAGLALLAVGARRRRGAVAA